MKPARAFLLGFVLSASALRAAGAAVPTSVFIVSDTNGLSRSVSDVTNMLAEVNLLYRQAATVFYPVRFEVIPSNDRAVMAAYGFPVKTTESECVAELFKRYQALATQV